MNILGGKTMLRLVKIVILIAAWVAVVVNAVLPFEFLFYLASVLFFLSLILSVRERSVYREHLYYLIALFQLSLIAALYWTFSLGALAFLFIAVSLMVYVVYPFAFENQESN